MIILLALPISILICIIEEKIKLNKIKKEIYHDIFQKTCEYIDEHPNTKIDDVMPGKQSDYKKGYYKSITNAFNYKSKIRDQKIKELLK